jgi:putative PIN family toxin of toxin-antitoxin system
MPAPEVVLDTNVLVAGLRSRFGAAFDLLSLVGTGRFEINLSVPLLLEYEDVLFRPEIGLAIEEDAVQSVLDYHCSVARQHDIFFLWRPVLKDPGDDMVLELAVKARARFIITYNQRDFAGAERFGVEAITPGGFLRKIGFYP